MKSSKYWIDKFELSKHPEGGYFKEIYRCNEKISSKELNNNFEGTRNLATSIYYLLESNDVSLFHRLISDEIWYYHYGSSVTIHCFSPKGEYYTLLVGVETENLQVIIPKETIFGVTVNTENSYCLLGCVVTPGFDFSDFEMIERNYLLDKYPQEKEIILKLTKT